MADRLAIPIRHATQYDGTNGTAIAASAAYAGWSLDSDNGTTLVLLDEVSSAHSLSVGDWLVHFPSYPSEVAAADFAAQYATFPLA